MDYNYKIVSNKGKKIFKENNDKRYKKRTKINEYISEGNYKNQSNNSSLFKENKNFISQNNTLEITKDDKNNDKSKKESLLLSSEKKYSKNLNIKNKIIKNEKIINTKSQIKINNDLISPKYTIKNKNIQKTESKINEKCKYITKKRENSNKISSFENRNNKFDLFLKYKSLYKTFRNSTENSNNSDIKKEILNKKRIENILNNDNIKLVKLSSPNNSSIKFYNLSTTNINKSIKKKKHLSLINQHNIQRHNTNIIININNNKYFNTDSNIKENYSSNKTENKLIQSMYLKNNNNSINFSNNKENHNSIKCENDLKELTMNINFNEIEKILDLDNKINDDERICDIEMNKINKSSTNRDIYDKILENIPEEDTNILQTEKNNISSKNKRKNYMRLDINKENNKELKNKRNKMHLCLNDNSINITTKTKQVTRKILDTKEKIINIKEIYSKNGKIRKITEYFNSNTSPNINEKYNNNCNTMGNNEKNSKDVYLEVNKNFANINNNLNKNKIKEERFNKLRKNVEEIKIENEKILKLKEKYENLIIKLKNDINKFNEKKSKEILLFNKYKQEEIEKIISEKNKINKIKEKQGDNKEIDLLKQKIDILKEEIGIKDNIYNQFCQRFQKEIELQNKKNTDLELKLKLYKGIIKTNNNNNFPNSYRNFQEKNINQIKNKIVENNYSSKNIKNQIYNKTLYNLNNKHKYISNSNNFISNSDKKFKKLKNQFNKIIELNIQENNNKNHFILINKIKKTNSNLYSKINSKIGENALTNHMANKTNTKNNSKNKKVLIEKNYCRKDIQNKKINEKNEINIKKKKNNNTFEFKDLKKNTNNKNKESCEEKNKTVNNLI